MDGLLFALAFVVVAVVSSYFFDDYSIAIRKHLKAGRDDRIAAGLEEAPPSFLQVMGFGALLLLVFIGLGWIALS